MQRLRRVSTLGPVERNVKGQGNVIGNMITADADAADRRDHIIAVCNIIRGSATQIDQHHAVALLLSRQRRQGRAHAENATSVTSSSALFATLTAFSTRLLTPCTAMTFKVSILQRMPSGLTIPG